MTENVLSFTRDGQSSFASRLSKYITSLPWGIRSKAIVDLIGSDIEDDVDLGTPSAQGSEARSYGFGTLGELINAMGVDSAVITNEIRASRVQRKFGILGSSPDAVMNEFRKITELLGRDPVNSAEVVYASGKISEIKIGQLETKTDRLSDELAKRDDKITTLSSSNRDLTGKIEALNSQARRDKAERKEELRLLRIDHGNAISDLTLSHQSEIEQVRETTSLELGNRHEDAIKELEEAHTKEIGSLNARHELEVGRINDYLRLETVPRSEYQDVQLELEQMRDINKQNLQKMQHLKGQISSSPDMLSHREELSEMQQKIKRLTTAYRVTQEALGDTKKRLQECKSIIRSLKAGQNGAKAGQQKASRSASSGNDGAAGIKVDYAICGAAILSAVIIISVNYL